MTASFASRSVLHLHLESRCKVCGQKPDDAIRRVRVAVVQHLDPFLGSEAARPTGASLSPSVVTTVNPVGMRPFDLE